MESSEHSQKTFFSGLGGGSPGRLSSMSSSSSSSPSTRSISPFVPSARHGAYSAHASSFPAKQSGTAPDPSPKSTTPGKQHRPGRQADSHPRRVSK